MLLVGSKALQAYLPLDRVIHDWDIWMTCAEYNDFFLKYSKYLVKETQSSSLFDINGTIVEIKQEKQFALTDYTIWENCLFSKNEIETPYGKCRVPDIQTIYDMKCATAQCIDEWKHHYDKELIEKHYSIQKNTELYLKRLDETKTRVALSNKNKYNFFHKNSLKEIKIATIPEYIAHDKLHEMIADLIDIKLPTYVKIINGDIEVDINLFHKLPYIEKVKLMAEESLVLALERWFIPQMVENGINYKLIKKFDSNNEASPTYQLLKHVNIKGLIGENPEIIIFGRKNFNVIEKVWIDMKEKISNKQGFPKWFYDEIFDLRDRYINGEKVGLHHENI